MRRWSFLVLVAGGIGVGHTLTYTLSPHSDHGHGLAHAYPLQFATTATVVLLAMLLAWSVLEIRGRAQRISGRAVLVTQLAGFAVLELGERAFATGLGGVLGEPVLWIGFAVQCLVAIGLIHGFRWIPRIVASVVTGPRQSHRLIQTREHLGSTTLLRPIAASGRAAMAPRAPPAAVLN